MTLARDALGLGLRPPHYAEIEAREVVGVEFFEVIAENFFSPAAGPARHLARVAERAPIVVHGIGANLLSADPLDREHLRRLKRLADRVEAPYVTDHLCWTRAHGRASHDLLPAPLTPTLARYAAGRARQIQDLLERPFGLENLAAMAAFRDASVDEPEFWREVVESAGCYYLLDLNNVFVSSRNLGTPVDRWLSDLDPTRILQVHVAGHQVPESGPIVDTHDEPVCAEVWDLYRTAWARLGPFPTLLERDARIPPYEECLRELERARYVRGVAPSPSAAVSSGCAAREPDSDAPPALGGWQRAFLDTVTAPLALEPPHARVQVERWAQETRDAVVGGAHAPTRRLAAYNGQYWFRLLEALQGELPTVARVLGQWAFDQVAMDRLHAHPPSTSDLGDVGRDLASWLASTDAHGPLVREAARVDRTFAALASQPELPRWVPDPGEREQIAERFLIPSPSAARLRLQWPLPPLRSTEPLREGPCAEPAPDPALWVLFRTPDLELGWIRAEPALATLLEALDLGPLGAAVAAVSDRHAEGHPDLASAVRRWFEAGVSWGWWAHRPTGE